MSGLAANLFSLANGEAVDVRDVSALALGEFREYIIDAIAHGMRLAALFGRPVDERRVQLWAILADDSQSLLIPLCTEAVGRYPSLTPQCPQAHWFEREIFEHYAVTPMVIRGSSPSASRLPTGGATIRALRGKQVKSG